MRVRVRMSSPDKSKDTRRGKSTASGRNDQGTFDFDALPVEIRHEVFKHLRTGYLFDVCSRVSRTWEKIVRDVINHRLHADRELERIQPHILSEIRSCVIPDSENVRVRMLKLYERSMLRKNINITPFLVNGDGVGKPKGMMYKIWENRPCDCPNLDKCIADSIYFMRALDLLVVQSTNELMFFHFLDLERLEAYDKNGDITKYNCECDSEDWLGNGSGTGISIFRNQIVIEEKPRAILLLKVTSCNHQNRTLRLERIRRVFLPIWSKSLCLLENKFYVLYSTGYVGMWDRQKDELSISPNVCGNGRNNQDMHSSKMFRIGSLVLIKTVSDDSCSWSAIDSEDERMEVCVTDMVSLITNGYLQEQPSWECTEVFHLEIWYNCLIVHCQVQSLIRSGDSENRLMIKRLVRYPTLNDFRCVNSFGNIFSTENSGRRCKSLIVNGIVLSPFLPLGLKPKMLDPNDSENSAVPVADIISLYLPSASKRSQKLKVYRIRISNLPFSVLH